MKLRILHVITSVDPRTGGPIEGIKQLSGVHFELGNTVEVATLDSPDAEYIVGFPLRVHALGPSYTHYRYSPRLLPWLRKNADRFDIIIVNGIWQYGGFAVWRALYRTRKPYFVFTHGMLDPWFKRTYPLKHAKKWLYWPWGEYRVLRDAAAVLFTCEEERLQARESFWLYRCNEAVVSYGTAVPDGDPAIQRDQFLMRYPELHGKRIILYLSRIHPKKGCDLLIEGIADSLIRDPALHLVMAGPDQAAMTNGLQALAKSLGIEARITWTGMLGGDLKWGAYRAAEAFILPSHQENFGIVVSEAMACGTPVLISDKVNIWREVVADGAGLVAKDTVGGTRSLLGKWLALDQAERTAMGVRARKSFENRFEIHRAAWSLLDAINAHARPYPA